MWKGFAEGVMNANRSEFDACCSELELSFENTLKKLASYFDHSTQGFVAAFHVHMREKSHSSESTAAIFQELVEQPCRSLWHELNESIEFVFRNCCNCGVLIKLEEIRHQELARASLLFPEAAILQVKHRLEAVL